MKRIVYLFAVLATVLAASAVTLSWDPNPAEEDVIAYIIYQSTNVAGPYTAIATVTGTNAVLPLPPGRYFWYVVASNFWGLASLPSNTVGTPPQATKVANPKVAK